MICHGKQNVELVSASSAAPQVATMHGLDSHRCRLYFPVHFVVLWTHVRTFAEASQLPPTQGTGKPHLGPASVLTLYCA